MKNVATLLQLRGITAAHYHGHLDVTSKTSAQDLWMTGDANVIIATEAFGTGIDFGSVRLVAHMDEPYSVMDMAQESGRVGQDGLPSNHIVLLPMA